MKRTTAAVAAALLGLSASNAQAIDPILRGSDTLESIMDNLIASYPLTSITDYDAAGSGAGEDAIEADQQELGPMSRFLTNTAGNTNGCGDASRDPTQAGCWSFAKDSITLVGQNTQACEILRWGENLAVGDANGDGSVVCPGCVGGSHPFADWRTVLRIIYAGEEVDYVTGAPRPAAPSANIATRCNSDVRRTLVSSWTNLFKGGCAAGNCASGLKHAWRRDDNSGTTAVFLELLGLSGVSTRPFCNGLETEDQDPVRRDCVGAGSAASGDTVCGFGPTPSTRSAQGFIMAAGGNSLGLVVPTLLPASPFNQTDVTRNCSAVPNAPAVLVGGVYNATSSGGGAFGKVSWTSADVVKYGANCPNGAAPVGGQCDWPMAPGTPAGTPRFGCVANGNSRPTGSANAPNGSSSPNVFFDARIYNLWSRNDNGTIKTYVRGASTPVQNSSMYRYRTHQCRQDDETNHIGCLTQTDTCSLGFAGFRATQNWTVKGLDLRTEAGGASADPTSVTTYPLARDLFFCQLDAFGSSVGTQSAGFVANQQTIYNDLLNNTHTRIDPAVTAGGFFTVPTYGKVCCPLAPGGALRGANAAGVCQ